MQAKYILLLAAILLSIFMPLGFYPGMIADSPADEGAVSNLLKLYPIAVLGYGLCAWLCRRDRLYLSWLLVVLSLLSSAAMLYLSW